MVTRISQLLPKTLRVIHNRGEVDRGPRGLRCKTYAFTFSVTEDFQTGATHVIGSIHCFISSSGNRDALPRKIFIPLDNRISDNENKFQFEYLERLLVWNIFSDIFVLLGLSVIQTRI